MYSSDSDSFCLKLTSTAGACETMTLIEYILKSSECSMAL